MTLAMKIKAIKQQNSHINSSSMQPLDNYDYLWSSKTTLYAH